MTEEYNPLAHSVVQAFAGGVWCRYEADAFIEALLEAILAEIKRVHWNVFQHSWGPSWHFDEIEDPDIPGIQFTRYYDGCECDDDENGHRPECRHSRPNFQHEDVQFRWYKYPGRGMSTNKDWTSDEWRAWFNRCLRTINAFDMTMSEGDHLRRERLQASLKARHPKAFERVTPKATADAFRAFSHAMECVEDAQTPCWVCSEAGFGAGGGMFEGGTFGTVARTRHEDDNPEGPCTNCGHVNTDEQSALLDERRRKNSDARRAQWADMKAEDDKHQAKRDAIRRKAMGKLTRAEREVLGL